MILRPILSASEPEGNTCTRGTLHAATLLTDTSWCVHTAVDPGILD
jgi:hypothetical protein